LSVDDHTILCPSCKKALLTPLAPRFPKEHHCENCGYQSAGYRLALQNIREQERRDRAIEEAMMADPEKVAEIQRTLAATDPQKLREVVRRLRARILPGRQVNQSSTLSRPTARSAEFYSVPVRPARSMMEPVRAATTKEKGKGRPKDVTVEHRRAVIRKVAATGVTGEAYVEALDREGLKPNIKWRTSEKCPDSYPAAYRLPKWKKRINDEKTKYTRLKSP
jgi:hypothetical protein